eukprot:TRINITY_DN1510_c3_g1_i1.p1 TRINITY_DN1510_c3_g1~~TRINITY_DN1510_c3_g1_i1.p1  ORF type:complete len:231 (+),score=66.46 TRINITY_DN1510_c3_g1_i1:44-736(+)
MQQASVQLVKETAKNATNQFMKDTFETEMEGAKEGLRQVAAEMGRLVEDMREGGQDTSPEVIMQENGRVAELMKEYQRLSGEIMIRAKEQYVGNVGEKKRKEVEKVVAEVKENAAKIFADAHLEEMGTWMAERSEEMQESLCHYIGNINSAIETVPQLREAKTALKGSLDNIAPNTSTKLGSALGSLQDQQKPVTQRIIIAFLYVIQAFFLLLISPFWKSKKEKDPKKTE